MRYSIKIGYPHMWRTVVKTKAAEAIRGEWSDYRNSPILSGFRIENEDFKIKGNMGISRQ